MCEAYSMHMSWDLIFNVRAGSEYFQLAFKMSKYAGYPGALRNHTLSLIHPSIYLDVYVKTVPHLLCNFLLQKEPLLVCVDPWDCSSSLGGFAAYTQMVCELKPPRKAQTRDCTHSGAWFCKSSSSQSCQGSWSRPPLGVYNLWFVTVLSVNLSLRHTDSGRLQSLFAY